MSGPTCDVIIPVGPGHMDKLARAVGSVEMARDYDPGVFSHIDVIAVDDTQGDLGRSRARNEGGRGSSADWLFFLDADDLMHPEAFRAAQQWIQSTTDPDAIWGKIVEYKEGVLFERFQVPMINSLLQLVTFDPYLTIQMGHFIRREHWLEFPFDEEMNTGEDWDYYLRVWQHCRCIKIDTPLMCNIRGEHSTGKRAATGQDWRKVVEPMILAKREELNAGVNLELVAS